MKLVCYSHSCTDGYADTSPHSTSAPYAHPSSDHARGRGVPARVRVCVVRRCPIFVRALARVHVQRYDAISEIFVLTVSCTGVFLETAQRLCLLPRVAREFVW